MLHDEPLSDTAAALRTGGLGVEDHLETLRDRMADVEPTVESFLPESDRWERLEREANALAERFPDPASRPALYGVPVGVKDIFHVTGFETRAGSDLPPEELAGPEASSVTALRDAGALILGKTHTTEFAYFDPGPTRNPHDPEHTPGGSSSGSAAAVAAGLCPLALGSQTIGSVVRPASFCGIVGFKPSYGRIPLDGVIPVSPSVDHVGFFTQDVPGARLAASTLCDRWRPEPEPPEEPTLGVPVGPYLDQASDAMRDALDRWVDALEGAGYEVRRVETFEDVDAINERHERLVAAETALSHDRWFPEYGDRYAEETADLIREGRDVDVGALGEARAGRIDLRERLEGTMDERGIDVWICPAAPGPAPEGIDDTGDPVMNLPWTHAGLPAATLPVGESGEGLPLGMQCVARNWYDEWLLEWADGMAAAVD